jgi:deuterolysin
MKMLSVPFLALGLASFAAASPMKRSTAAPGLAVTLSHPSSVSAIGDLTVTASVKNTGSEAVKVLKYGTVLDDLAPTKSFSVAKDGKEVQFKGLKLSLSLPDLTDKAFVVIAPGETVHVTHKVADRYDFAAAGAGKFTFEPVTTFQVSSVPSGNSVAAIGDLTRIDVSAADKVEVAVSGEIKNQELPHDKRAVDTCTNSNKSFIDSSYSEGKSLASVASSYIGSHGADSLFTSYYKTNTPSSIQAVFNNVANENSSSRTLNCSDPYAVCGNGVIAYTVISTTNIYFCSIFYNEVTTSRLCSDTSVASRNIRGGTVLHELTHATSGTTDVGYGCSFDQGLSASQAKSNADNYNCFATQVYASTKC